MQEKCSTPLVILRRRQVEARTGLSCSSLYRYIAEQKFPAPIDLGGGHSVGWVESEVQNWLESRVAARDAKRG
ncbi:AlpA family transcriptional regulator [Dechloromonas denitrificans]|nr:AlpA family transcriptional regulator [Dechloromonas denitrificans]